MDLISREAVLDGVDKYIEKAQSTGTMDDFISFAELVVKALPSAFEGKTNGEVIKALFPKAEYRICEYDIVQIISDSVGVICVPLKFWNAPYQKGGE